MTEMLAVVVLIGVMAALSSPMFINMMRDRRVNQSALTIAEMYRVARSRALGRGMAVMIRWNETSTGEGSFEMRESVIASATQPMLAVGCTQTNWTNGAVESRALSTYEALKGELSFFEFRDTAGGKLAKGEICFSPRGRTFFRDDPTAAFVPLVGVPTVLVKNETTQVERIIQIPPNGTARLTL